VIYLLLNLKLFSMKISCIIIDDEPNALSLLEGYILKTPSLNLKGKFFDALDALEFLRKDNVDLIFTDINMPELTGLELAEILPGNQKLIFTTAHAEFALTSFSYHVIDYLLKPITFKRFLISINKAGKMGFTDLNVVESAAEFQAVMFAKSGKQVVKIDFKDIIFIKGEKEYVSLHFKNDRLLIYKRMKDMEAILPVHFKRIHTSYIVNLHFIHKIEMNHVLIGEESLPISESYRGSFLRFLNKRII
jgi:two-component system LytT family response regulator